MGLEQGWANFLTRGPQWVLKFDRGAGPGAFGGSVWAGYTKALNVVCANLIAQ